MLYRGMRVLVRALYSFLFRIEVRGSLRLPEGPSLVVANHTSAWDPPLVGVLFPRQLRYMAKVELFRVPLFGGLLRMFGAFPVTRGQPDRAAIRTALELLRSGWPVVVFPEGTRASRAPDGRPGPARRGVAYLALLSGAPVVPVAIRGEYRFRGRVVVSVGEPFHVAAAEAAAPDRIRERTAELADGEIMARVRALWDESR
ncbi:MAG: 1-acyl-sn-glycerol-3-phosphate acyltransferase [Clostridia bacterium]|nr:1-acyl-sn-glycerol-3-phosphate acyltransferase [Clostridia bacterium]